MRRACMWTCTFAGIILLSSGGCASVIHPRLKRYTIFKLDAAQIKASADVGDPFSIKIGAETFAVRVTKAPVFDDSLEIISLAHNNEQRRTAGASTTYSGSIVGQDETTDVRLTITPQVIMGYIRTPDRWWFIEPLRKFRLRADATDYLAYRTTDVISKLNVSDDLIPYPMAEGEGGTIPPTIGFVSVIDTEYLEEAATTPFSAYQHVEYLLNTVNGIFLSEFGCEFKLRYVVVDYETTVSTDAEVLLSQVVVAVSDTSLGNLRLASQREAKKVEVAHLTSGKNFDGTTLGVAWGPGVHSASEQHVNWVGGGGGFLGPPDLAYENMLVTAHELGHSFNGSHDEADKWCVTEFIVCFDAVRTLMWPTIYGDNRDYYSDGSRDPSHNNKERIGNNISSGRGGLLP